MLGVEAVLGLGVRLVRLNTVDTQAKIWEYIFLHHYLQLNNQCKKYLIILFMLYV